MDEKDSSPQEQGIQVLEIVGCFLAFFGILLLIAVAGENTVSGRVTNLVSALILLAVGGGMFWRGVVRHRGAWLLPVVLFAALAAVSVAVAFFLSRLASQGTKEPLEKTEETQEEAAASETAKPDSEKVEEGESGQSEEPKAGSFLVKALRSIGWAMRDLVESIWLKWLKIFTVIGFAIIAAVVWLVRRETVFEGVTDRKWWRDLRLWTAVIMATQVIIYLLLGTYTPKKGEKSSQGASGEIHRSEALPRGSEENSQQAQ